MINTHTRTQRGKRTHRTVGRDVDRIIKKAMHQSTGNGLRKKVKLLKNSINHKTGALHTKVGKYAHKKPYTSLSLAALTGAALAFLVNKSLTEHPRHRLFKW